MEPAAQAPDLIRIFFRDIIMAIYAGGNYVPVLLSLLAAGIMVGGYWVLRGVMEGARNARIALRANQLRAQRDHRALVLVARIEGFNGAALRNALQEDVTNHFGAFAFGAPVQVEYFPIKMPLTTEKQSIERRRKVFQFAADVLTRSQADILVWGRRNVVNGTVELRFAAPPSPSQVPEAHEISFKWRPGEDFARIGQAIAYLCARRARPVLNRPQDYKPEKLQPIVQSLQGLSAEGKDSLNLKSRLEILGDFASGALSLGERGGETRWLSDALEARRAYLDGIDRASDPAAWGRAQQEVGRALAALGEREADRAKLEEAVQILRLSLDALRATESLQSAEVAMRALSRAEQTLAQRKRIGLRWPV